MLQLIDAVQTVTGSADTPPGAIPWEAVGRLHPTRSWLQLCNKWPAIYYLHSHLLDQRRAESAPVIAVVGFSGLFCLDSLAVGLLK